MGHRGLIAYQEKDGLNWTSRYTHWGALNAKLLDTDWIPHGSNTGIGGGRHGKRQVDEYDSLQEWAQDVDFLFHEAVYAVPLGKTARAFDTLWWRGARNYTPSPAGTKGVGALVELESKDEWYSFAERTKRSDEMTAIEFHEAVKDQWGDRIPDWSPMGGDELRVRDQYLDE